MAQKDVRDLDETDIGKTVTYDSPTGNITGRLTSVQQHETATSIAIDGVHHKILFKPPNRRYVEIEEP
jgi:hypothetical protein